MRSAKYRRRRGIGSHCVEFESRHTPSALAFGNTMDSLALIRFHVAARMGQAAGGIRALRASPDRVARSYSGANSTLRRTKSGPAPMLGPLRAPAMRKEHSLN